MGEAILSTWLSKKTKNTITISVVEVSNNRKIYLRKNYPKIEIFDDKSGSQKIIKVKLKFNKMYVF